MKGEDGTILELIEFATAMKDSKDKIEPLKKILSFRCDD